MDNYNIFFWKHNSELNKDTDLAHRFGENTWNHQQEIIDDLKKRLDKSETEKKKYFTQVINRQSQIKSLQEQSEKAIKRLESIQSPLKTYEVEKAIRILRGEADD